MTDVSTDTGALRAALRLTLQASEGHPPFPPTLDALVDGPLRDLIAERDQAVAAVERVRELLAFYDRHEYSTLNVDDLRRALDPT